MREINPLILLGAVATILILVGTAKYDWNLFSVTSVGGCQFVMQPLFGRIECEPISSTPIPKLDASVTGDKRSSPSISTCGDNENTNLCDFTVKPESSTQGKVTLFYQFDGSGTCQIGTKDYCTVNINTNEEARIRVLERAGTRFAVGGACLGFCIFSSDWVTVNIYTWFIPYGLNVYDSGQKIRYNTQSCDLASLGFADRDDVCISSDGSACAKTKTSNRLAFDDWVNYLTTFTIAPIDVSNKVVTYNNQQAYCQINKIYSLSDFTTEGTCYKYPKTLIASVDCCPSMETANSRCGDDFKWHAIVIGQCDASRPCQTGYDCISNVCQLRASCFTDFQCSGQGVFYVDYSKDKTISRQSCVSGQCKIVESKTVQCTPPNNGCPSGQVCNVNKGYICETQEGEVKCGDSICTPPFETNQNCPTDCKSLPFEYPTIIAVIIGVTILAVMFLWGRKR